MRGMFLGSKFNGYIFCWDVSHVLDMDVMFKESKFDKNLSELNNMGLASMGGMFDNCVAPKPWWYVEMENSKERMEGVKRIWILKMKEKIEERIIVKWDDERKKIKK